MNSYPCQKILKLVLNIVFFQQNIMTYVITILRVFICDGLVIDDIIMNLFINTTEKHFN